MVDRARSLRSAERFSEAVRCLRDANVSSDGERLMIDRELVFARYEAARARIRDAGRPPALLAASDVERSAESLWPPAVARSDLSPECITDAIASAGCLWVKGLLDPEAIVGFIDGIDRAFAGYDRAEGSGERAPDPWFSEFIPEPSAVHATRPWLRAGGGLFTADSPRVLRSWFETVEETGVLDVVSRCFRETPVTSLDKCALRRIPAGSGIEWHQDGSFLGPESYALNVWLTLTDCSDAPGLEIVSRRFAEVTTTGTGGAGYDWSTGPEVVAELARTTPIVRPDFKAGDALIFDGLLLHRTAQEPPAMPKIRYAIETWFFRPSRFPSQQEVPLAF